MRRNADVSSRKTGRLLLSAALAALLWPAGTALGQSQTVDATWPNGGAVETSLQLEEGTVTHEVSRTGPNGGSSDKTLIIQDGTATRDVVRTNSDGGTRTTTTTVTKGDGKAIKTSDGSLKHYPIDDRIERRDDRQEARQDRRENRRDVREDRRDNRQDRREDRQDRRGG